MSMANTVDTEFRGVTGTLVANSTFDSEVSLILSRAMFSSLQTTTTDHCHRRQKKPTWKSSSNKNSRRSRRPGTVSLY